MQSPSDTAQDRSAHPARLQVETLRWRDGRLEMLDQRLLPLQVEYRRYESAEGVADAIRSLVVRGAPAIGCAAAYGVALEGARLSASRSETFSSGLERGFDLLRRSRPTAVNLAWALDRQRRVWSGLSAAQPTQIAHALLAEAHAILQEDIAANRALGGHGSALVPNDARILTHCNAGALATGGYGTALGIVRSAAAAGKRVTVVADETRPVLQGARLTAWELTQEGIGVTLIADVAAALLMARGEIDMVIVGADRVAANGDVANKIGTYGLAVLAQRHAIPFYVACPLSTIDLSIRHGSDIPIEERSADEVTGFGGVRWAPDGVAVRNPAFDVTPVALVTALITDRGVVQPVTEAGIRGLCATAARESSL
ncbi:MAG TPA: S-methyl-5-thioribose-1-phosphate isomerase [Burkholderiales bacterium]|nr:S-methyl-5-thioribose-1-phosphate isomerase [Burkholderiales bacterium]